MAKTVLIVDDSMYMRTIINDTLAGNGYQIVGQASTGEEAIDMALDLQPDYITLDNILPDMLGLDIVKNLREEKIRSKIVMISAVGQQSVINTGMEMGADAYVVKPFTSEQLLEILAKLV